MFLSTIYRFALIGMLVALFGWRPAFAQANSNGEESAQPAVSQQQIDAIRERLESSADIDESVVPTITQLLDDAAADLQSAGATKADAAKLQEQVATADKLVEETAGEIAKLAEQSQAEPIPTERSALQAALVETQAALADAEKVLSQAVSEPSRRQARLLAVPDERTELKDQVASVREQLAAPPAVNEVPLLSEARTIRLNSQLAAAEAALERLENERAAYAATAELLPLQRQLAERKTKQLRSRLSEIQAKVSEQQQEQIKTLRERVLAFADGASAEARGRAEQTLEFLDRYEAISARSAEVGVTLADTERTLAEIRMREQSTTKRVEAVGLTEALALLLQRDKSQLNKLKNKFTPDPKLRAEIRELQLETFRLEDQTGQTITVDEDPETSQEDQGNSAQNAEGESASSDLSVLRAELLSKLVPAEAVLFQQLVTLDTTQRQLRDEIDSYLAFIEENLLWTRNSPFITAAEPSAALVGFRWLVSPVNWAQTPRQFLNKFVESPVSVVVLVLLSIALFVWRSRWRRKLGKYCEQARRRNCLDIEPTLRATLMTVLLAAPIPIVLTGVGWIFISARPSTEFLTALGSGLYGAAGFAFPFLLLCQLCRKPGLGIDHFGWLEHLCKKLRQSGRDIATAGGALVLIVVMLSLKTDDPATHPAMMSSLGRYLLLTLLLVLLFNAHMIFHPRRLWAGQSNVQSFLYRQRNLIYFLVMLLPLAIALLCALGYEYMTFSVMEHLIETIIVMLAIVVLQAIAKRALLVRRRRLTIAQFREQRDRRDTAIDPEVAESVGIDLSSNEVDLGSISDQAQQLVRLATATAVIIALAVIWIDLLPGLRILDRMTLWTTGTTTINPVTLSDILFSLGSIAVTVYAVRSLPALVELFLLQRLSSGARYAITTIFRYVIGSAGLLFGLSFLSIPWSQLSWILAAASVGLGFGLQEILANFVSGIILLLEQPIRVGDIVTVDGSTGVVSKMQIRATTVTNWDRQELVIPNKDLVTGKLLNWTLSNVINRVVINVGVAYGSDPNQVRELLNKVVCEHPEVLVDPPPIVTFEQFGDSSLNFVIRCYLPSLEKRLLTIHELHAKIASTLNDAGIQIPFPQRDIHMSIEPAGATREALEQVRGQGLI